MDQLHVISSPIEPKPPVDWKLRNNTDKLLVAEWLNSEGKVDIYSRKQEILYPGQTVSITTNLDDIWLIREESQNQTFYRVVKADFGTFELN